jgi:NADH/NAD ratio-sensing transcriptional regulator Rex
MLPEWNRPAVFGPSKEDAMKALTPWTGMTSLKKEMDGQLKFLAQDIERNLQTELQAVNEQLNGFDEQASCEAPNLTDMLEDESRLPLDQTGSVYPYFSMAWWADTNGQQLFKWTVASNNTPIINLADREYVRAIIDGRAWPANNAVTNSFRLEPLYSRTRGENVAMFSIAARSNAAAVAALELRLVSLVKTVLPPGYGFCVVGDRGQALFHSDEQRNLRENFVVECEDDGQLQANLGMSTFTYQALFDTVREKIGQRSRGGVAIYDIADLRRIVRMKRIRIAVIAVPAAAAHAVLQTVVDAGVKAVLNFSPGTFKVPDDVKIKSVDLTVSLESLSFFLAQGDIDEA